MKLSRLIIALIAVAAVACTDPATRSVENLQKFVAQVEQNGASFTDEEWALNDAKFERLCADIEANHATMTPEQQKEAMKSMGVYYGLQTRLGIKSFMDEAKKAFESLPSFLEGFGDGFSEE